MRGLSGNHGSAAHLIILVSYLVIRITYFVSYQVPGKLYIVYDCLHTVVTCTPTPSGLRSMVKLEVNRR